MEQLITLDREMATEAISKNRTSSRLLMNKEIYAIKLKALFIVVGLCISFSCFSQLLETKENEVKLDFFMILMKYPTISYERFLGKHVGAGLSAGFPLTGPEDATNRFLILPYGRFYFLKHRTSTLSHQSFWIPSTPNATGCLFIEINTGFFGRKELDETTLKYHNTTKSGMGTAIGYKIIEDDPLWGISGEVYIGIGWGIDDFKIAYPRVGVSIAKSF